MSGVANSLKSLRKQRGPPKDGGGGDLKPPNNGGLPLSIPVVTLTQEVTVVSTLPGQATTATATEVVPTTIQVTLPGTPPPPDTVTSSITGTPDPSSPPSYSQTDSSNSSATTITWTVNSVLTTSIPGSQTNSTVVVPAADNTSVSSASASAASRLTHRPPPAGAIAGGVIAGIILIVGCIFLILVLLRRRRKRRSNIEPFPAAFTYNDTATHNPNHGSSAHLVDWWQPATHPSAATSPDLSHLSVSRTAILTPNRSPPSNNSMSSWAAAELPRHNEVLLRENEEFWEEIEQLRRENEALRLREVTPEKGSAY